MSTTSAPASATGFDRGSFERVLADSPAPTWAKDLRREAFARLDGLALPDRRNENWMRTDLRLFKPKAWGPRHRPGPEAAVPTGLLAEFLAGDTAVGESFFDESPQAAAARTPLAGRLLSLDGHVLREELDPALAARGVLFGSADRLLAEHGELFRRHWFTVIDSACDWFASLHAAFHAASVVLYVPQAAGRPSRRARRGRPTRDRVPRGARARRVRAGGRRAVCG
ncbi:MAG: hypothetical protein ACKOHK_03125, partial [Planctomycetia bacterium]